jgi:hypothetical protein
MHLHFAADRNRVGAHPRKRTSELDRFFITFVGASAIAEIANVLLPTLGPMSVLAGNAHFLNVPTLRRTTANIVFALREGRLASIDLGAIDGIISFRPCMLP